MTKDKSGQGDYEEAYKKLRAAYITRLKTACSTIDALLQQRPMNTESLKKAKHLVHGLAGSGTTFGFPEVSACGKTADIFIDDTLGNLTPDQGLNNTDFTRLEKMLRDLQRACESGTREA